MNLTFELLVYFGSAFAAALPWNDPKPSFSWHDTKYLLAFGDSYTYVQGIAGLQNFSFIGDLQNYTFTKETLLEDEIVQNQIGTSAGGPNWVEYLTGCFSGLPSKCKLQLWDFAFAGSDVSTIYTPPHHNYTVSFVDQIAQWAAYAKPVLPIRVSDTLVAIFIGINDISDSSKYKFPRLNTTDFPSFYNAIISTEFEAIETLYQAGYKNYLFMNLPPLDRTPAAQISSHPLPNTTMVSQYNAAITYHAQTFASTHPGTKAMVFDTYAYLSGILDNPAKYGIVNTTNFCKDYDAPDIATNYAEYGCLPIREYFWYDAGHITFRVHELLAGEVGRFLDGEEEC